VKARAGTELPVSISAAETLWYDVERWPMFIEGFGHVERVEGDWPRAGAGVVWESTRAGRGRVVERVVRHEPRVGQTVEVTDPSLEGVQRLSFTARSPSACRLDVELDYSLRERGLFTPVVDALFVRGALTAALRRTLARFAREVRAEAELH
jgi:hypothetical protein